MAHVPLRRRRRRKRHDLSASRCIHRVTRRSPPPSSAISRFLPNSWRRDRSSSIHFRGSNYFYGVLSRRRKLRVIEITGNRCTAVVVSRFRSHREQRFLFTDTKYRSSISILVIYFANEIYFRIQFFSSSPDSSLLPSILYKYIYIVVVSDSVFSLYIRYIYLFTFVTFDSID